MKSAEWYTEPKYIEAARTVMGKIDLDPASCAVANKIVKATTYYTQEQNGLEHPWYGRVWLNPPYGRSVKMEAYRKSTIALFVERLLHFYESGDVSQAIVLATTEVNAKWFYPLWQFPICIPDHRVHFIVPEKLDKYSQMFGTCFAYLGEHKDRFADVFSQFGNVVERVRSPKTVISTPGLWTAAAAYKLQVEGGAA